MIEVDISNVWGDLALPELLAMEKTLFDAHMQLTDGEGAPQWGCSEEEILRIQKAAERIQSNSQVCVVLGSGIHCRAARGVMALLGGVCPDSREKLLFLFAGDSLSTRQWKELEARLEGRDFSVIVAAGADMPVETGVALRSLRWMLERKYGTDEANSRIYAAASEQGILWQIAREAGWETFAADDGSVLAAADLLPLAAVGIDILQIREGAMAAKENYDLRAYENPVWLYAAVRELLWRKGRRMELLASFEPGFRAFGGWWQQLFLRGGRGAFPVAVEYPADLASLKQRENALLETLVRFAPGEAEQVIVSHWQDLDGLNILAGKTMDFAQEQAYAAALTAHVEENVPVITMDCGALNAHTLGELIFFLELACGISDRMSRV